jgi:hypothetical protein
MISSLLSFSFLPSLWEDLSSNSSNEDLQLGVSREDVRLGQKLAYYSKENFPDD